MDVAWLKEREAYESDAAHAIDVVAVRKRWHAAIAPLHASLEQEAREIEASRKAQERYDAWPEWRRQRESGPDRMAWLWYERAGQLFPATHHASVVRLSLAQFRRGLAVLNAVAVAATKRGFEVTCDDKKGRVVLKGHGGELELRLSEATEQKTRKVKRYDGKMEDERYRVPTGRLRIYVERGYGKVWSFEERADAPLELRLNALFVGVWKQVVLCRQKTRDQRPRHGVRRCWRRNGRRWNGRRGRKQHVGKRSGSGGFVAAQGGPGVATGDSAPGVRGGGAGGSRITRRDCGGRSFGVDRLGARGRG